MCHSYANDSNKTKTKQNAWHSPRNETKEYK